MSKEETPKPIMVTIVSGPPLFTRGPGRMDVTLPSGEVINLDPDTK